MLGIHKKLSRSKSIDFRSLLLLLIEIVESQLIVDLLLVEMFDLELLFELFNASIELDSLVDNCKGLPFEEIFSKMGRREFAVYVFRMWKKKILLVFKRI